MTMQRTVGGWTCNECKQFVPSFTSHNCARDQTYPAPAIFPLSDGKRIIQLLERIIYILENERI